MIDVASLRAELAACRQTIDRALGRALQIVDQIESERAELARDQRMTAAERDTFRGDT